MGKSPSSCLLEGNVYRFEVKDCREGHAAVLGDFNQNVLD